MHTLIGEDLYELGKEKWKQRDVVGMREEACLRLRKKGRVRSCIINGISDAKSKASKAVIRADIDSKLLSQKWVCTHANNLNFVQRCFWD